MVGTCTTLGKDDSLNLLVLILNFYEILYSTARFCSKKN